MLTSDLGDMKSYSVECSCSDTRHAHHVVVEVNEFGVETVIYTTTTSKFWSKSRWQQMWQLLTRGYIESEVSLIMHQQQALNYGAALTQAVTDLAKISEKSKKSL